MKNKLHLSLILLISGCSTHSVISQSGITYSDSLPFAKDKFIITAQFPPVEEQSQQAKVNAYQMAKDQCQKTGKQALIDRLSIQTAETLKQDRSRMELVFVCD